MKNLLKTIVATACIATSSVFSYSQEIIDYTEVDTSDMTKTICLSECRHFVSFNVLQLATGTLCLDYEFKIVPQFSVKIGAGTIMGTRILFNESQLPCIPGGFYGTIEPRYYFKKASESCLLQYGIGVSYKYWNFVGEHLLTTIDDFNSLHKGKLNGKTLDYYNENNHFNVTDDGIYEKEDMVEHLGGVSFFGKGCIASGLTAEFEVGFGLGVKAEEFYFTPNLGLSFGWTFGKIKEQQQ